MPWRHIGEWRYSSTIPDLGTRWRWVVSVMPRPLYPWGKSPLYPLDRRLGGPQSWSGCYGEEKNLAPARNRTLAVQPVARCYINWAIPAPQPMHENFKMKCTYQVVKIQFPLVCCNIPATYVEFNLCRCRYSSTIPGSGWNGWSNFSCQ
jgi:hypothetical protein